jgi:hypothetical protein
MRYCFASGCRFADTHITGAHRCGTCGLLGHGQVECGDPGRMLILSRVGRLVQLPLATQCAVASCRMPWTHTTAAHHCATCGQRGGGCGCGADVLRRQCPSCRRFSDVDIEAPLYTGGECIVCAESKPVVMFADCRHANVCADCVRLL